ncbi:MAG: 6-phosphofructokinase, partial [Clostridia bacterium]|nr:6-phosphofructokinase [Clostridia bacterium]
MNILVGQSGGPTAVINSSLAGVIKAGFDSKKFDKVYGMVGGIQGVLEDDIIEIKSADDNFIKLLKQTPSSYLGSCRKKLGDDEET